MPHTHEPASKNEHADHSAMGKERSRRPATKVNDTHEQSPAPEKRRIDNNGRIQCAATEIDALLLRITSGTKILPILREA